MNGNIGKKQDGSVASRRDCGTCRVYLNRFRTFPCKSVYLTLSPFYLLCNILSGTEIRGTFFKEACDKFQPILEEGKVSCVETLIMLLFIGTAGHLTMLIPIRNLSFAVCLLLYLTC
jgi:hypothetical protein